MLFGVYVDLMPAENSSAITVQAQDAQLNTYPLIVEFVGTVPSFNSITEVIVKLPDNFPAGQDVWVSVTLRGQTSNKARFKMK